MLFLLSSENNIYQNKLRKIKSKYITIKDVETKEKIKLNYILKQLLILNVNELKAMFVFNNIKYYRLKFNNNYYDKKLIENKNVFDNVLGYPLDIEQRKAIINDEWNTLILAGAGSGKTLTMVGKVLYLLNQGIKASEILVVSFTNASVKSFFNKISKYNNCVDVFTFHKLSLNIIKNKNIEVRISKDYFLDNIMCKHNIKEKDKKLIGTFIQLFKGKNLSLSEFDNYLISTKNNKEKNKLIITIKKIYIEYERYLRKKDLIDFNDMINLALKMVDGNSFVKKYKYVLVDEYQDTSLIKFKLLKRILEISNSKLIAVGDDWQSIYRFTGCELMIFLNFKKLLPYSNIVSINNAYRNSQELINVASNFIIKNPYQLYKNIKSNKKLIDPVKIILYDDINSALIYVIKEIISKFEDKEILVLGRNNNDILLFDKKIFKIEKDCIIYNDTKVKYMTVHKSKGLEANNVVVINLENKINGFPSKIIEHEILRLVSSDKEDFIFDEERRLFYVALTRTKNFVYLLAPIKQPSLFVLELIKNNGVRVIKI